MANDLDLIQYKGSSRPGGVVTAPGLQRQTGIQPAASPQNFTGAMAEVAGSLDMIGSLGKQVAKHAAIQQSEAKAYEDAKTPGRMLLPVFSDADKAYVDTYKAQEYSIALQNGGQGLSRLGFESLKKPSAESLTLYDEQSQALIDNLVSQVTPETGRHIKDALGVETLKQRFKIEAEIFKRDERFLTENFQGAYEHSLTSISDAIAIGDEGAADAIISTAESFIDNPDITYNLSPAARIKLKNVLVQTKENSQFREEILEAIRTKTVAQKLEEITHEPFTSKNMRKAEVMLDTYKQQLALTAASDDLIIDAMKVKMANNTLSPSEVIAAKDQVDPSRFSGFEVEYTKWLQNKVNDGNIYDYFVSNRGNGMALAWLSGGELDKAFGQYVKNEAEKRGVAPSLQLEAAVAAGTDIPIPSFNKKLNAGINSMNPEVAAMASSMYGALAAGNPNAVAGVTNDAGQKAESWNRLLTSGSDPAEAFKEISKMYDVTPAQLKEREETYKREIETRKLKTIDKQKEKVASEMGFRADIMPEGLALEFMDNLKNKYLSSGSFKDAWSNTAKQMAQVYQETDFNGFKQVMRNAPTKWLPSNEVKSMKFQRAEDLFAGVNKAFESPEDVKGLYSYQMSKQDTRKVPNTVGMGMAGLTASFALPKEDKIILERKDHNGNITKGILVVMPDKFTDYPPAGTLLSYGMYFQAEGQSQLQVIYDANNQYSNARFNITVEQAQAYQDKLKSKDEKLADELDRHIQAMQAKRAAIIEQRLEAGEDLNYEG